MLITTMIITNL